MKNTRKIELKGAYNFRDIGGYPAPNGKKTMWGMLYRSDHLAKLTGEDLKYVEQLNIKLIIDLRTEEERLSHPNRLPRTNPIEIKNIEIRDGRKSDAAIKKEILSGKTGIDLKKYLIDGYSRAVSLFHNELRLLFKLLLDPTHYPALILCTAGKDRTGLACALILSALGVSKETVMKDYLLSRIYLEPMITRLVRTVRVVSLFRADIIQLRRLFDARSEYLNAALDTIDRDFGSMASYLDSLGMDNENRSRLRDILCA